MTKRTRFSQRMSQHIMLLKLTRLIVLLLKSYFPIGLICLYHNTSRLSIGRMKIYFDLNAAVPKAYLLRGEAGAVPKSASASSCA